MGTILTGKKEIKNFVGRSWDTILKWINEQGFPARKMEGVWESDSDLIADWRRKQITGESAAAGGVQHNRQSDHH